MQGGAALAALTARIRATIARCGAVPDAGSQRLAGELDAQWTRLEDVTRTLHGGRRPEPHARERDGLPRGVRAPRRRVDVARAGAGRRPQHHRPSDHDGGDDAFYRGKLAACRYFFAYEVPKVGPMLDLLASLDTTTLTMQDAWF